MEANCGGGVGRWVVLHGRRNEEAKEKWSEGVWANCCRMLSTGLRCRGFGDS